MKKKDRMMSTSKSKLFIVTLFFLWCTHAFPQDFDLQGQLSGWITVNVDELSESQTGVRYIPGLSVGKPISKDFSLDVEISFNVYGSGQFHGSDNMETNGKIKPYRLWLRFTSSRFEARLGLQKINFGSATLLRPLMWFDRIDPRDPLQLTDGVYGLLVRYYFLNNVNVWLWGLYGNKDLKGWELLETEKRRLETGGRLQVPLFSGEIAFTYHHRQVDLRKQTFAALLSSEDSVPEDRFGLDGKWDIGIGVWFEGVLIHRNIDIPQMKYQKLINVGLDYTFGLGNGLTVLHEYFVLETSEKTFSSGDGLSFSALSLSYPIGLLDRITGMVYYDWEREDWYRFINFQRILDHWTFYLIGFWNPDQFQIYQNRAENNLFAGKGFQLMVALNH